KEVKLKILSHFFCPHPSSSHPTSSATPNAPALAAMTPFFFSSLDSSMSEFLAPRSLKEPVNWVNSCLRNMFEPQISLRKGLGLQRLRTTPSSMRNIALLTSSKRTGSGASPFEV